MVWISLDEHMFSHSWDKVVQAALRKYPNPKTKNIHGSDVYERNVDKDGKMHSKRLISSVWCNNYINWVSGFIGLDLTKTVYAIEYSVLDPAKKLFELSSRNYNFLDYIVVDEKLVYTPHPTKPDCTLLKQEWHVTCKNLTFKSFLEHALGNTMKNNAVHGRQGIEYVIKQVKEEVDNFSTPVTELQLLASQTVQELSNLQQS